MKRLFAALLALFLLLALTACGPEPSDPTETANNPFTQETTAAPNETVGNPFASSTTAPSVTADAAGETEPQYGATRFGGADPIKDDVSAHYDYTGGELKIGFHFYSYNKDYSKRGVGPLFFLDGIPQPYKTEEEPWYSYVHFLSPKPLDPTSHESDNVWDVSFIPVTGQAGDALALYITCVSDQNTDPAEIIVHDCLQYFASDFCCRVIFYETPPELELPEVPDQVLSHSVTYVDEPILQQWSPEELQLNHEYSYYINGGSAPVNSLIWPGFDQEPITLSFQIYGSSYVKYTLVCFKDYEPISIDPEDILYVEVKDGQRTKIDVQIDMSDFDGSTMVPFYVVLVPRNLQAYEDGTPAFGDHYRCRFENVVYFFFAGKEE